MSPAVPVRLRVGVVDTGVNPWHSHVRGAVAGCRVFLDPRGRIREDGEFFDPVGHGTAVAGVLRQELPGAEIYAVRVFGAGLTTYPSLVARGMLRAAAEGCAVINLSLAVPPGPGSALIAEACGLVRRAGCRVVAAGDAGGRVVLPAALPGVLGVVADDALADGEVGVGGGPYPFRAPGRPRDLAGLPRGANLLGGSFACARVAARAARDPAWAEKALDRTGRSEYKDRLTGD
ncbi:S8 family peptidase [Deferrisoma camini]|uniref:S8 family peptidase n=1 Tax=Deferrisoma camini TaxID=1035120 RepID=UPI00146A9BCE|nr:S8/S53 family peptidase [Deferrisoma camini]